MQLQFDHFHFSDHKNLMAGSRQHPSYALQKAFEKTPSY